MQGNIALLLFSDVVVERNENFAEQWHVQQNVSKCIDELKHILNSTNCEWLLLWDDTAELPPAVLLAQLTTGKVDVWHAGLKMGVAGLPKTIDYVNPTWMYNKDADINVIHSSFRLSIKASLIRTSVLKQLIHLAGNYSCIDAMGLALGYAMIKSGCIMRYHPGLLNTARQPVLFTLKDEWIFARQFYSIKWHIWILMNSKGLTKNLVAYFQTSGVKYQSTKPCIHQSDGAVKDVAYKTVSVLAPTLKRYPYLVNELKQLSVQTILPQQVLITDQTDIEERESLPIENYPQLHIQYFPQEEKGQCLAWNKLLSESTGEYVLFLGDDADHITPDFIEKLLGTAQNMNADMVASNVIEIGTPEQPIVPYYYMSNTFPITLIRKDILDKTGYMDMFFNRNIRADQDLMMRCHLQGSLMIYNPSATVHHHRASVGGLRTHKARVITNYMARNSVSKFVVPTSSELYLVKKYFNEQQFKSFVRIKYFNQLMVKGSILRKVAKLIVFIAKYPSINKQYHNNLQSANEALAQLKIANTVMNRYESVAGN